MGSIKKLDAGHGYIAYARFDGEDCAVVAVNVRDEEISLSIPVWEAGVPTNVKMKMEVATSDEFAGRQEYRVKYGRLHITLPAKSACVFSCRLNGKNHSQQMSMFLS